MNDYEAETLLIGDSIIKYTEVPLKGRRRAELKMLNIRNVWGRTVLLPSSLSDREPPKKTGLNSFLNAI